MWVNETIIWAIAESESMTGEKPRGTNEKTFLLHVKQVYIKPLSLK